MALTEQERTSSQLEAWKKVVDVQQHFNDMEMRIRTLCLTVLGTIWGAAAYSSGQGATTTILGFKTPLSTYLLWLAVGVVFLFWLMDGGWYHFFLRGAVATGQKLEDQLRTSLPGITLTASISKSSHVNIWGRQVTSATRGSVFYGSLALFSFSFAVVSHAPTALLWHVFILSLAGVIVLLWLLFTGLRTEKEITNYRCEICNNAINKRQHCETCDRQQSIEPRNRSSWRIVGALFALLMGAAVFASQWGFDAISVLHR